MDWPVLCQILNRHISDLPAGTAKYRVPIDGEAGERVAYASHVTTRAMSCAKYLSNNSCEPCLNILIRPV